MFVLMYADTRSGDAPNRYTRKKQQTAISTTKTAVTCGMRARYNYLKNIPAVVFAVLPEKVFFARMRSHVYAEGF